MAVTTEASTQAGYQADPSTGKIEPTDSGALRLARFDFTQGAAAGDATSTVDLVRLPAGKVRIMGPLSRLAFSALGASRVIDVGHTGYTEPDGDAITADEDAFAAAIAATSAGASALTGEILVESRDGFLVQAKVEAGTLPAAATMSGYIAYLMG